MELVPAVGVCLWGAQCRGDDPTEGWLQCPKGMAQGRAGDCSGWDHELPSPSFVKPTPWGHSLASLPAPRAGSVTVGRILEART